MQHAVAITAYTDFDALWNLVTALDPRCYRTFVHVDAKSSIGGEQIAKLTAHGCRVVRKHAVPWGGYAHLLAVLDLLEMALERDDVEYVHVVSGQDYPAASFDEMKRACDGRIYMTVTPLENASEQVRTRYETYNVFWFLQAHGWLYGRLDAMSSYLQRVLRIRRRGLGVHRELYKGMIWTSLPAEVCRFVLGCPEKARWLRALRTTYVPEELFFQTLIMNSRYRDSVVRTNLRYTDWSFRNGSCPAVLDVSDLEPIVRSRPLFVRKMDSRISTELMRTLRARIGSGA